MNSTVSPSSSIPVSAAGQSKPSAGMRALLLPLAFGLMFVACGLIFGVVGWNSAQAQLAALSWPHAPGQVVSSRYEKGTVRNPQNSRTEEVYRPYVSYRYQVGGSEYTSSQIEWGELTYADKRDADRFVRDYKDGKKISVYYSPDDPSRALLMVGLPGPQTVMMGVGALFAVVGVMFVIGIVLFASRRRGRSGE